MLITNTSSATALEAVASSGNPLNDPVPASLLEPLRSLPFLLLCVAILAVTLAVSVVAPAIRYHRRKQAQKRQNVPKVLP